jgi:8-oxo-dGTP pyrophosphatase MutT (NUDIX family)
MRNELLDHRPVDEAEAAHLRQILDFVDRHADPFDRNITEGHLTGSAFVVSHDGTRVLLVHHKRLDRWLQPGGHAEPGERSGLKVALREAREETAIEGLRPHSRVPGLFDVDVHEIPAREDDPRHLHLDLRYVLVAPDGAEAHHDPAESLGLRWFRWDELDQIDADAGLKRAVGKLRALLLAI